MPSRASIPADVTVASVRAVGVLALGGAVHLGNEPNRIDILTSLKGGSQVGNAGGVSSCKLFTHAVSAIICSIIIIGISIITNTVIISIEPLSCIQFECVINIQHAVVIFIFLAGIGTTGAIITSVPDAVTVAVFLA